MAADPGRALKYADRVSRALNDPRFPRGGRFRELVLVLLHVTWIENVAPEKRMTRARDIMGYTNQELRWLLEEDVPRYEPPHPRYEYWCEEPTARKPACGSRATTTVRVTNPANGAWRMVGFCSRHRSAAAREETAEKRRKEKGVPEPVPNRGGLLPSYFRMNPVRLAALYQDLCPRWEPPLVGVCADDWPVLGRVHGLVPPAVGRPSLTAVDGGGESGGELVLPLLSLVPDTV